MTFWKNEFSRLIFSVSPKIDLGKVVTSNICSWHFFRGAITPLFCSLMFSQNNLSKHFDLGKVIKHPIFAADIFVHSNHWATLPGNILMCNICAEKSSGGALILQLEAKKRKIFCTSLILFTVSQMLHTFDVKFWKKPKGKERKIIQIPRRRVFRKLIKTDYALNIYFQRIQVYKNPTISWSLEWCSGSLSTVHYWNWLAQWYFAHVLCRPPTDHRHNIFVGNWKLTIFCRWLW